MKRLLVIMSLYIAGQFVCWQIDLHNYWHIRDWTLAHLVQIMPQTPKELWQFALTQVLVGMPAGIIALTALFAVNKKTQLEVKSNDG